VLGWLEFLALAGAMLSAVVASRLLERSFRPPWELSLMVEAAAALGCGVPFVFLWHEARPLTAWIRNGRPADAAPAAWETGVMLIRRVWPRCFVSTSVLLIPADVWAIGHYHLGPSSLPVAWVFTQLGVGVTAAYMFFVGEAMLRPMVEDAARVVPPGGGVRRARGRIGLKVLLALAVTTSFAVLISQAIGSIGHTPTSRLLGAVVIAVLIALTFTPVLIRAVTDSVVGPVRTLTSATARAAAGDLEHPVPVTSDDELGVLTTSFNDMIRGLREREALRNDKLELSAALRASLEDLHRYAEELRASRARVVTAADVERRRMERDLHDGAQQQLVLLGLKLGLWERLIEKDPAAAKAMHDELRTDLRKALSELRELAHGIYPAVLESEGLPGALREAIERAAIPTELRCDGAGRYPRELEAAVYFCCLEALQNAAKHAGAGAKVKIDLAERTRSLVFQVADDGRGYDTTVGGPSVGVQNMQFRERHERRIAAPPAAVWAALHELRLSDLALSRALMDVRALPSRLLGRPRPRMLTARLLEDGPVPVLASDFERSVVAGSVMQPWKLAGGTEPPVLDAEGLRAFHEAGWVKTAMDFVLQSDGKATLLSTETRVSATDAGTRGRFGLYWLVIRVGSGLIRGDLLRAVARRAEGTAR